MLFTPRDYQSLGADHAEAFLRSAPRAARQLYAGPTGSGKSVPELMVLERFPGAYLVTPRVEIVAGLLEKLGLSVDPANRRERAEELRIFTPVRLRNRLADGSIPPPSHLIIDEGHHWLEGVSDELDALTGDVPAVAFTATPYRGTPKSTAKYRKQWGDPIWLITFAEAAERGVLSLPQCRTVPLVDDDVISVTSSGEFVVRQASELVQSRLDAVVDLSREWCYRPMQPAASGVRLWDRPTMFSVPSVDAALSLNSRLNAAGLPAEVVTGETPDAARAAAFRGCIDRRAALVQINVVSEGVDLPLRRHVDLHPTLSPVEWLQRFGRITRPVGAGEPLPEYVSCCRNLLRHAYLLDGCLPVEALKQGEEAFVTPSKRAGLRVVGFESLGRFKGTELPLADGLTGMMYCLSRVEGHKVTQYAVLAHPAHSEVIAAQRTNARGTEGTAYGKWERIERIPELTEGFASVPAAPVSEKQIAWWARSARAYGLDSDAKVNRRNFAALPVLSNLKVRL